MKAYLISTTMCRLISSRNPDSRRSMPAILSLLHMLLNANRTLFAFPAPRVDDLFRRANPVSNSSATSPQETHSAASLGIAPSVVAFSLSLSSTRSFVMDSCRTAAAVLGAQARRRLTAPG